LESASTLLDDKTGCDTCGADNCGCRSGGNYAGIEATFLATNLTNNRVFFDDTFGGLSSDARFDYGFEAAPRVWVGREASNGWGIRGRYWQFDTEAHETLIDALDPINNDVDGGLFQSSVEAYTVDLEVTRRMQRRCWDLLGSLGVRHGAISHRYLGQELDVSDTDIDDNDIFALGRRIDGTGISGGVVGRRPVGSGNLTLFWSMRGSALWGDNKVSVLEVDVDDDDGDVGAADNRNNDMLYIGEAQLGLEVTHDVQCLAGARVFLRSAFEYQIWDLPTSTISGTSLDTDPAVVDSLGQGDANLYGVAFSAGIVR